MIRVLAKIQKLGAQNWQLLDFSSDTTLFSDYNHIINKY